MPEDGSPVDEGSPVGVYELVGTQHYWWQPEGGTFVPLGEGWDPTSDVDYGYLVLIDDGRYRVDWACPSRYCPPDAPSVDAVSWGVWSVASDTDPWPSTPTHVALRTQADTTPWLWARTDGDRLIGITCMDEWSACWSWVWSRWSPPWQPRVAPGGVPKMRPEIR